MAREIESLSRLHVGKSFNGRLLGVASAADADSTRHIWNAPSMGPPEWMAQSSGAWRRSLLKSRWLPA